jgi:hypothetical protein
MQGLQSAIARLPDQSLLRPILGVFRLMFAIVHTSKADKDTKTSQAGQLFQPRWSQQLAKDRQ